MSSSIFSDNCAFRIAVLVISIIIIGVGIANIFYFNKIRQNPTADITSGVAIAMIVVNAIVIILALALLIWAIVGLVSCWSYGTPTYVVQAPVPVVTQPAPVVQPAPVIQPPAVVAQPVMQPYVQPQVYTQPVVQPQVYTQPVVQPQVITQPQVVTQPVYTQSVVRTRPVPVRTVAPVTQVPSYSYVTSNDIELRDMPTTVTYAPEQRVVPVSYY